MKDELKMPHTCAILVFIVPRSSFIVHRFHSGASDCTGRARSLNSSTSACQLMAGSGFTFTAAPFCAARAGVTKRDISRHFGTFFGLTFLCTFPTFGGGGRC